jgi:hypothetical protein
MSKERLRKAISNHTEEYLARGGVIEPIPRVVFCPANMPWAKERGWDYTPWDKLGGPDLFAENESVGEGCYIKKPAGMGEE